MTAVPDTGSANTWLYAVVQAPSGALPESLTGVAGEPLRLLDVPGLAAVAGSVPRADFDEEALNAHIQDPAWLERAVRDHHRVVCVLGRTHRVLPMRFATLCQDDARAVELLTERHDRLLAAVDHVSGRTELGVKAWSAPRGAEASGPADGQSPGAAYLSRLRARRDERDRATQAAMEQASRVHARLAGVAADWVQHPPQPGEATGRDEPMLLNCAYLVDDDRLPGFRSAVDAMAAETAELTLELTGPWPPYSFAGHERQDAGEGESA
ncbi:GvpL/GvpF family gas vesicle protein [Streptacidiphilus neutrinimicus]|uniref:GvpL/GvpF family gas vesicle protein n=1 Tax=Streptacidiphilus neutrinimicus TaxID=105420 RepID=UPI0005A71CBA|nr:GvpL/GvpF family gas vesicle protein [Streptacidiphilus neutrinimicus]